MSLLNYLAQCISRCKKNDYKIIKFLNKFCLNNIINYLKNIFKKYNSLQILEIENIESNSCYEKTHKIK